MAAFDDLTGRRFGSLFVQERVGSRDMVRKDRWGNQTRKGVSSHV